MFTMEELLSKRNQRDALVHFKGKKDGCGEDGMRVSEFEEYWQLNQEQILKELMEGTFEPGMVKCVEIINRKGKKRVISSMNVLDRFICRLLSQKLRRYLEPEFLEGSFAYRENKGVLEAVQKAKTYIDDGDKYAVVIDVKDFFDKISIERVIRLLEERQLDERVLSLMKKYFYCRIMEDGRVERKKLGLVQGNSMSPVLSNLYLQELDCFCAEQGYHWLRFGDDLTIYTAKMDAAEETYRMVVEKIYLLQLDMNEKKSGIYPVLERKFLGYEFFKAKNGIDIRKIKYEKTMQYRNWHPSALQMVANEYHILQDGVLNKQDYTLLFENETTKQHIPVAVMDQINVYGNITISSAVLKIFCDYNLRVAFMDKYGNLMGHFVAAGHEKAAVTILKQAVFYENVPQRLVMAKQMEIAAIHNLRANIRYYHKKQRVSLKDIEAELTKCIVKINEAMDVDTLLVIEARARQMYYMAFNRILTCPAFSFHKRSRRPPEDPINAMISFGNTMLYNQFLQMLQRTTLDPRIGLIHATNKRKTTLNLDFADLFKPIIVDRVIFSLVNRHRMKAESHFEKVEDGGVYLNQEGKRIFIEAFEEKINQHLKVGEVDYTYRKLMQEEVRKYQRAVVDGEKYKPYKYY